MKNNEMVIQNVSFMYVDNKHIEDTIDVENPNKTFLNNTSYKAEPIKSIDSDKDEPQLDNYADINSNTCLFGNNVKLINYELQTVLSSMLESETFENGIANQSEYFFKKLFNEDRDAAINGISTLFYSNFELDGRKVSNVVGILHIISHMEYKEIYPIGQVLALAALIHDNDEVNEFAIKCFENWGNADAIAKLEAVKFSKEWLQGYANDVINELKEGE